MDHSYADTLCTAQLGPLASGSMDLDELLPLERQQLEEDAAENSWNTRPSKSVSFGDVSVSYIESCADMDQPHRDQVWFRRSELEQIKRSAKDLCKLVNKNVPVAPGDSIRGMDVYFPSRQRAHSKFVFHVLQAYHVKCDRNSEYVGLLAESWSSKSKERALVNGIQDFYEAYFPHMVQQQQKTEVTASTPRKRTATAEFEPAPRRF